MSAAMELTAERSIGEHLRSAARIEPDRLPRLARIAAAWAEAAARRLNALYASPVTVEPAELAPFAFAQGAPEIGTAALAVVVRSTKWRESALAVGCERLADTLVDALFGGDGRAVSERPRPMTAFERPFVEMALAEMIGAGNEVFEPVEPFGMAGERTLAGPVEERLEELLPEDNRAFILFAFKVGLGRAAGTVRMLLPEAALQPFRRKLATVPEAAASVADEAWARDIQAGLEKTDLEVRAILDETPMTLGAIARLAVGQTIELGTAMDSLIVLECENRRLFRGRIGRSRDAYVLRVEESIDPTEEFIDDILSD